MLALLLTLAVGVESLHVGSQYAMLLHEPAAPTQPKMAVKDVVEEGWIDIPLDNFNESDTRTLRQRYKVNRKYYRAGGPAFYKFGGEGAISENFIQTHNGTTVMQLMKAVIQYGGIAFEVEHRYYGQTIPDIDTEKPENMRYLSSQQALADAAYFIKSIQSRYGMPADTRWIAVGGSYSGALAAWMRLKYPDLVVGALSSSGPVEPKLDYTEYYGIASDDLRQESQLCFDRTKQAFEEALSLLASVRGVDRLKSELNLCHLPKINDSTSRSELADALGGPILNTAQYGGIKKGLHNFADQNMPNLCKVLTNDTYADDGLARLKALYQWHQRDDSLYNCLDNSVQEGNAALLEVNNQRGWMYQTCTEFGFFQTTSGPDMPFGGNSVPLEYKLKMCNDVFRLTPEQVRRGIQYTRDYYGGQRNFTGTNVVIMNGSQDPWAVLGVYEEQWARPGQTVVMMQGAAHCADMYPDMKDDADDVKRARRAVHASIKKWLTE